MFEKSLIFITGLVPPSTESMVFSHIASHGFTVVAPHKYLTLPTSQYDAKWLVKVDEWAQKNLVQILIEKGSRKDCSVEETLEENLSLKLLQVSTPTLKLTLKTLSFSLILPVTIS